MAFAVGDARRAAGKPPPEDGKHFTCDECVGTDGCASHASHMTKATVGRGTPRLACGATDEGHRALEGRGCARRFVSRPSPAPGDRSGPIDDRGVGGEPGRRGQLRRGVVERRTSGPGGGALEAPRLVRRSVPRRGPGSSTRAATAAGCELVPIQGEQLTPTHSGGDPPRRLEGRSRAGRGWPPPTAPLSVQAAEAPARTGETAPPAADSHAPPPTSVPKIGLEPIRPRGRRILNPLRLPIPPLRLGGA